MKYRIVRENNLIKVQILKKHYGRSPHGNCKFWETIERTIVYNNTTAAKYTDIFESIDEAKEYILLETLKEKNKQFEVIEEFDSEKGTFVGVKI